MTNDPLNWHAHLQVERWDAEQTEWVQRHMGLARLNRRTPTAEDFRRAGVDPYEATEVVENLLTTAGLTRITALIVGAGGQAASNLATRLGLGNGAGGAAITDTDLGAAAGAANRWYQIMDATFPTTAAGVITFKSTFASADGNFAWNEFAIDVAAPTDATSAVVGATLLNHKTAIAQGTKTAGQTWAATATITLS